MVSGASHHGLSLRAGLHTGECDFVPGDLAGIAVHVASRVCDMAEPGAVLVTSTVKDLAMGGDFVFKAEGSHALRGVSRRWRLFSAEVRDAADEPAKARPAKRAPRQRAAPRRTTRTSSPSTAKEEVRVVIADDHPLWRATLRQVLERSRGFRIVGEAADGAAAITVTRDERPDVVVLDMEMPSVHGLDVARELSDAAASAKVLVLSSHEDRETVLAAVEAGAAGYLLKTADASDIRDAIRRVAGGEIVFPPAQAEVVLSALRNRRPNGSGSNAPRASSGAPAAMAVLSKREGEVLQLMAEGLANQAIAQRLVVSLKTVESHVSSIFTKLEIPPTDDLHRRVTAVVAYIGRPSKAETS